MCIPKTSNLNLLKSILQVCFIVLVIASIYISPIFEGFFSITIIRPITLVLGYALFLLSLFLSTKIKINNYIFFYTLLVLLSMTISLCLGHKVSQIGTYTGILTALFLLISKVEFFNKVLKIIFLLCFFMVVFEYLTKDYIYTIFREVNGKLWELNPKFFQGAAKIFRAKGLFEGPLTLTNFAAAMSIYYKDNLKYIIICILMCLMANGRLGILFTGAVLLIYFIRKYKIHEFLFSKKFLLFLFVVLAGMIWLINIMGSTALDRLLESFNFSDRGNVNRFLIWGDAINEYSDYSILHKLFGDLGYFKATYGYGPESGWLMLLLDLGLIGFLLYLIPFIILIYLSVRRKTGHFLYITLLFLTMVVQTFHSGASPNLLYWIIIFVFFIELTKVNPKRHISKTKDA